MIIIKPVISLWSSFKQKRLQNTAFYWNNGILNGLTCSNLYVMKSDDDGAISPQNIKVLNTDYNEIKAPIKNMIERLLFFRQYSIGILQASFYSS